jgi:hypothetical protein
MSSLEKDVLSDLKIFLKPGKTFKAGRKDPRMSPWLIQNLRYRGFVSFFSRAPFGVSSMT